LASESGDIDEDPRYLSIPLVVDTRQNTLLSIGEIDHQKQARRKHTAHQQRGAAAMVLDSDSGDTSNSDDAKTDDGMASMKQGRSMARQKKGKSVNRTDVKQVDKKRSKKKARKRDDSEEEVVMGGRGSKDVKRHRGEAKTSKIKSRLLIDDSDHLVEPESQKPGS
jgi:hypothetical protein